MADKNFVSRQDFKILNKFSEQKNPAEKKQTRFVLGVVFGTTLGLIFLAIAYREAPMVWQKINEPGIAVAEKLTLTPSTPTPTPKYENTKRTVDEILVPLRGKYGIYFEDLETRDSFSVSAKEQFTAASLIKMPVILTLYREAEAGKINLDEVYKLQNGDKRSGAGPLQYKPAGYEVSFRQMAELMGKQSDNTAFSIVSQKLGAGKIQATIDALGMKYTSFADNLTTPEEMGIFFRKLYSEKIVSDKSRDEILSFITSTIWEDRIPMGVPKGVKVAHKIGTEVGVISDAGIVFAAKPFILIIMTDEANEIEAKKALPEITKKIYEMTQGLDTENRE